MITSIIANGITCRNFIKCVTQQEWSSNGLAVLTLKVSGKTKHSNSRYEMYEIKFGPFEINSLYLPWKATFTSI